MYLLVAIVIYRYAGTDVTSPALGSTSPLLRKVAYGIAIPTIVIAGVINGHVAAKYIYVRMFRGTEHMSKRTWFSWGAWVIIITILWVVAWIIAEAIPVFNDLLGLISALFASWFTYGLSGLFWLHMNKGRYRESRRKMFLTGLNVIIFCIGGAIVCLSFPSPPSFAISDLPSRLPPFFTFYVSNRKKQHTVRTRSLRLRQSHSRRFQKQQRRLYVCRHFQIIRLNVLSFFLGNFFFSFRLWHSRPVLSAFGRSEEGGIDTSLPKKMMSYIMWTPTSRFFPILKKNLKKGNLYACHAAPAPFLLLPITFIPEIGTLRR